MNTNSQQPPAPPSSGSIQIDMESGNTRPAPTASSSDSFGVLRGRLMDGIRRVMLPPGSAASSGGGLASNSSAYSVLGQNQQHALHLDLSTPTTATGVLAHHRYVPSSNTAVQNLPQVVTNTTATVSNSPNGTQHHFQFNASRASPGSPQSAQHDDSSYYPPVAGGLDDDDLPQRPGGGVGGVGNDHLHADDNQRNVDNFTDAMAQHPELRSFVIAVLKTLPFVGILLLKLGYDNVHSLLNLCFLGGIFVHANLQLKKEIAKKQQKSAKKLCLYLFFIAVGLFMKWMEDDFILDIVTMLSYRTVHTFPELLYYLLMADLSIKCLTVAVKSVITMLPERLVEFKGRGRIYLLVEAVSQFYRCFLPVQPWAAYLLNNYEGYDKIYGTLLVVAYVFWKFREVVAAGKFLRDSYIKFKQNSNFGTTPTSEEVHAGGNQCPICHESFSCPIRLECGHIFCDLCIGVWFDRETTCPLCRKKITDDPRYRDGATSLVLQVA